MTRYLPTVALMAILGAAALAMFGPVGFAALLVGFVVTTDLKHR